MARYSEGPRDQIDAAVDQWKTNCLLADGSLTKDDHDGVWGIAAINELFGRFNENQILGAEGGGSFESSCDSQRSSAHNARCSSVASAGRAATETSATIGEQHSERSRVDSSPHR